MRGRSSEQQMTRPLQLNDGAVDWHPIVTVGWGGELGRPGHQPGCSQGAGFAAAGTQQLVHSSSCVHEDAVVAVRILLLELMPASVARVSRGWEGSNVFWNYQEGRVRARVWLH